MDCKRIALIGVLCWSCTESSTIPSRFDGPMHADVLDVEEGPFDGPVGIVANSRNGRVLPVDLVKGWLLADNLAAPFLAADAIAFGSGRVLGETVVHSPDGDAVDVFAVDLSSDLLLQAPWITGKENGQFVRPQPTLGAEILFIDHDESGDSAELINVQLQMGATTTEEWRLESDGESWSVVGSASGPQQHKAWPGTPFMSEDEEVRFTIVGSASAGDEIRFTTDTGVVAHDLGGSIQEFRKIDGTGGLALITMRDAFDESGRLVFFDLRRAEAVGDLPLPEGSAPYRVTVDALGARVFVSDPTNAQLHVIELNQNEPLLSNLTQIDVGFPVMDLAYVGNEVYEHLFLARADKNEIVVWDLLAGAQRDVNLATPEIDGIALGAPVMGLASAGTAVTLQETTSFGAPYRDETVAIATFAGELWLAEGATGCFVQNSVGPYAYTETSGYFYDEGAASNPDLEDANGLAERVEVSSCGGLVRDEDWTVTFDEVSGTWQVEGTLSGIQDNRASEDTRYVSDSGTVSFLITSGSAMTTQGDQFRFTTRSGLVVARGDTDSDGQLEVELEYPGRPVAFSYPVTQGLEDGWRAGEKKTGFLWPIVNSDVVLLVDGASAVTDALLD